MEKAIQKGVGKICIPDGVEITPPLKIYLEEIAGLPVLSEVEERKLAKELKSKEVDVRTKLQENFLRKVIEIAGEYADCGMLFLDLIQEGNLGLMSATQEYEGEEDGLFSVFAIEYVKDAIVCALSEQGGEIKLPTEVAKTMQTVKEVAQHLRKELGHDPTVAEVAHHLPEAGEEEIKDILSFLDNTEEMLENPEEDEASEVDEMSQAEITENAMALLIQKEEVRVLLENLEEQEKEIIAARFGLDGEKEKSYEQLADMLHLSEEEVINMEAVAMQKLRDAVTN